MEAALEGEGKDRREEGEGILSMWDTGDSVSQF